MEHILKISVFDLMKQSESLGSPYIKCKDYTVSGREFELRHKQDLDMLVTFPQPEPELLPSFYKSADYISHTDSRKSLVDKIYQWVKNLMLDKKLKWIEERKNQGRLLDFGAGTGDFLSRAKDGGWNVFGVEPDVGARRLASKKGIDLVSDLADLNADSFDVITLWHVLEHVPDLEAQIKNLHKLLKPDGLLVVAVPNFKSYDARKYGRFWAAYDVPRHLWHFSRSSISELFRGYGFEVVKEKPLIFDSFYVSLLSEKYKFGKQNLISGFFTGLVSNISGKSSGEYSSIAYFIQKYN